MDLTSLESPEVRMTFKGIFRDGIVILESAAGLRNGEPVEVQRSPRKRVPPKPRHPVFPVEQSPSERVAALLRAGKWEQALRIRLTKEERMAAAAAAYGSWKDRPEWRGKSSAQISRELRRKAARRGRHG